MSDSPKPPAGKGSDPDKVQIRCPRCGYRPRAEDRWACMPSCGTQWHTFWTGGTCPTCGVHWPKTQCPACGELSPHRQWYAVPEPETEKAREAERI